MKNTNKKHTKTQRNRIYPSISIFKAQVFISRTNILHFLSTVLLNTKISSKVLILVNGKFQNSFNKKVLRSIRSINPIRI